VVFSPLLKVESAPREHRRHQRVKVAVLGRYMLASRQEFPCQTINMSPGGVAIVAPVPGGVGERVICYLDQLGRVEGSIARVFDHGFAISFTVPLIKREKLADQLTWLANRHALGMPEDRRHERITPRHTRTTLVTKDGREHIVKLIDVSMSGAALVTETKPPIGSTVQIGKTPAHVVRSFANGIAVEFARPFSAEQFSDHILL
jgi:hypothetical protein